MTLQNITGEYSKIYNTGLENKGRVKLRSSLIIPAFNEESGLPLVIEESLDKVDEIIVVDDGSTDRTLEVAREYNVKVIPHEKNKGKAAAINTGIMNARGDIIILIDADYTYPARYIPQFIREIENGGNLILGNRMGIGSKNIPFLNRLGNGLLSIFATYISCVNIKDSQTGFRAFKKDMFKKLDVDAKSLEYETKMTIRAAKLGYKIVEIPIEYRERVGESKLNVLRDGYLMFWSIISVLIEETSPIAKTMLLSSLFFLFIGIYFGVVSAWERVVYGPLVHGYYPLISTLFIFIAIQIFSVGLVIDHLTKKLDRIEEKIKSS